MQAQRPDRVTWRVFGVLMAAGVVAALGLVPYLATVLRPFVAGAGVPLPLEVLVLLQIGQVLVLVAAATALGLWLGPRVGLGAPLLHDLLRGERTARLTRTAVPGPALMWAAIMVTAVLFGLSHLPATALVWPLTPLVVARALVLNGLGGLVFGWLYWRRGLLAAMVAHLGADLVLHVATPLLG